MFSIQDVIALAIRLEQNGEAVYRDALEWVKNPEIRNLLNRLAEDENNHARWFAELAETPDKSEDNPILDEMRRSLTDDFFAKQAFSLKDVDFASIKTRGMLIEIAIGFEKDSILFYEMLAPFVSGKNASETLQRIIEEEKTHIKILEAIPVQTLSIAK